MKNGSTFGVRIGAHEREIAHRMKSTRTPRKDSKSYRLHFLEKKIVTSAISTVVWGCMHLDVTGCKSNRHCGLAQQFPLSATQLELDERAWAKRELAWQAQAEHIGRCEIIVMNDDHDHGAQEPCFIGETTSLH